ncbi:MAG TPA: metallophosphoesterase family protein [Bryobacteraceae bacterium]|nr:metallophosphoesterase family protein [Bryobacteraceae bacterium]
MVGSKAWTKLRVAVVSDVHGNLTALEAVIADLRSMSPDLVFHGGDLANGGSQPAEAADRIRDLGWPGVVGNGDELMFRPESLDEFAARLSHLPQLATMWDAIREMAARDRELLGEERLRWLSELPISITEESFALVHASPVSCWRSPGAEAEDRALLDTYGAMGRPVVVFGHIHVPFVRRMDGLSVINAGSVSLSYDGDPRASYLLFDDGTPQIRRVEYDVEREIRGLEGSPHAEWTIRMLRSARPVAL